MCIRDSPSSKMLHFPEDITSRRKSLFASFVRESANIVRPSTHLTRPFILWTSCLMSEMSMDVRLSSHWEAGLVSLLMVSNKDFESVTHTHGSRATSSCHCRAERVSPLASKMRTLYQCTDPRPPSKGLSLGAEGVDCSPLEPVALPSG